MSTTTTTPRPYETGNRRGYQGPAPGTEPWDRQPFETSQSYRKFLHYRDAGESRALAKTASALGVSTQTVFELSSRWGWVDRVNAYDESLAREKEDAARQKAREDGEKMTVRHRSISGLGQAGIRSAFTELVRRLSPDGQAEYQRLLAAADELPEKDAAREKARLDRLYNMSALPVDDLIGLIPRLAPALQTLVGIERVTFDLPETVLAQRAAINVGDADKPAEMPGPATVAMPDRGPGFDADIEAILNGTPATVVGGINPTEAAENE
jgi:hypothetical protein